jgi:hypothetical protein
MKFTQILSSRFAFVLALFLVVVAPSISWSQGSINGGLRGVVTDATGAAIPGADLRLISLSTGAVHSQTASSTGEYSFTEIAPGNYRLSIAGKGFQRKDYTQITITLNETHELNVSLDAGEVTTVVEVTGDVSTVVSLDTSVGSIIDSKQILDLPLNGRDFQNLIVLTPGAVRTASGENQGSGISAGGSRGTNNNYIIDGGDANDPRVPSGVAGASGGAVSAVPLDAIAEFSVLTSSASAEFGRSSGAVVNVVTKSGANAFHASAWEFLRNSVLNTRNFFNPVGFKSPFKQNQFGFWAGGRIIPNRTFFSTSYEGFRQRSTSPTVVPIPTAQFTQALTNPLSHGLFASMYPSVSGPAFNQYDTTTWQTSANRNIANNLDGDTGFVRIDQKITGKNSIFATFGIVAGVPTATINSGNLPTFGVGNVTRSSHMVVEDDHIFSAHLLNAARFSFQRTSNSFPTETPNAAELASGVNRTAGPYAGGNFSASAGDINGIPTLSFSSGRFNALGQANNIPQSRAPIIWDYQDTVSYQHGAHSIKLGAQITRVWDNTIFSSGIRPIVTVLDTSTAAATPTLTAAQASAALNFANINSLALNSQSQSFYAQPSARQYRLWEQGYFAQDSFRVNKRITVDLGIRYQIFNPFTESNNLLSNAYLVDANNKPQACSPLPFNANLSNVALINPAAHGIGSYCSSFNDVSPRIGFAYDVFGSGKTVLRGGYGIYYDRVFGNIYGNSRFNPPYTLATTISSGSYTGAQAAAVVNTTQSYAPTVVNPALKNPVTNSFNLAISQEVAKNTVFTVTYVGATGYHLLDTQRPNFGTSFADAFRPANQGAAARSTADIANNIIRGPFSQFTYSTSNGVSNYNGLLVGLRRTVGSGLSMELSYTYAHSHDVVSDEVAGSADSATPQATLENLVAPYMATGSSCPAAQGNASSAARLTAAVQCAEGNSTLSQAQAQSIFLSKYVSYASIRTNYGDSIFDVRQRFAASVSYVLPFGHDKQFLTSTNSTVDHLVSGWGVTSIFDTQTGIPFIPISGVDANEDGDSTDRVIVTGPVPNRKGSLTKNFSGATPVVNYFPACGTGCPFSPGLGVIDPTLRMHRGYLRNPGLFNWDAQLNKQTSITEKFKLRFTTDFFNALNHTNFANLKTSTASTQFGQATSTRALGQTNSRQIQFGLHLVF